MRKDALVLGNASLLAPWQFTNAEPNEHRLMVNDQITKKPTPPCITAVSSNPAWFACRLTRPRAR
jgi:hypothetical protein